MFDFSGIFYALTTSGAARWAPVAQGQMIERRIFQVPRGVCGSRGE